MQFDDGNYSHHPMSDYVSTMDPEVYGHETPAASQDVTLGINEIGMSVPMGISASNVAGIYSKIRMGAGNLEIQFPGYRTGQRNAQTPGLLGEDQRQALREMQEANEVRFTTHASYGLMGMMGRDERGNFSLYGANMDLMELKRAIDFQADMGGGSVVMHSGEFERPMTDMVLDDETGTINLSRDETGRLLVKQGHTQEMDAKFDLMDDRTSQKMETVQKDRLVAYPVWKKAEEDYEYNAHKKDPSGKSEGTIVHVKKGDYVDYQERLIEDPYDNIKGRVPVYDPESGRFKTKLMHFDDFRKETEEYNDWLKNKGGYKKMFGKEWHEDPNWFYYKLYPEEKFLHATLETQEGHSRGWALQFGQESEEWIEGLEKLNKTLEYYKKLDKSVPQEEKWKLLKQYPGFSKNIAAGMELIPSESKDPVEVLENAKKEVERRLEYSRESSVSQEQQAEDTAHTREHLITPIKRLEKDGLRMYAEAGIHAMQKTSDPENPVTVAIENLFPERFGGHIEELKWIIRKSRDRMTDLLTKPYIEEGVSRNPVDMNEEKLREGVLQENPFYKGISRDEAQKISEKHIKATIDTGHLNMWRKFWQQDPKLDREENDAKFKKWYLGQIESLAKDGMVGNVHLADNFGYQDDHLSPGQGNAPVKEAVAIIKKHGYDKAITVEPGADATTDLSDFHGLMKTWRLFGSPIYGMGGAGGGSQAPQNWTDIQYSYFGQNQPPNYVFGGYAPSNDWTMWSAVSLE